ncbi:hypothetical protein AXX12_15080 [Anaerosporomusa subterranea]|uniref:Uncharacterized protein n=1 Tax=Anaerosporomusa subterranea TaxID=1794912 RepID=A0A154BLP8_ANASB|nr:hypothetical protein AXX12_15080 [Anaerosporomusa subterranea]
MIGMKKIAKAIFFLRLRKMSQKPHNFFIRYSNAIQYTTNERSDRIVGKRKNRLVSKAVAMMG